MPISKLPYALKVLSKYGEAALKPVFSKTKYFGPLISRRIQANLRKRAIINGTYGKFIPGEGGWDSNWDRPRNMFVIKPLKLHKSERTRPERALKITKAMQMMPERLEKYKQEAMDKKPKKDLPALLKRIEDLSQKNPRYRL